MSKLEQAARQIIVDWDSGIHLHETITALREALAEPVPEGYMKCPACNDRGVIRQHFTELERMLIENAFEKAVKKTEQAEQEPVAKFLEDNLVVENERVGKSGHRVLEIREEELLRIMEIYAAPAQPVKQEPVGYFAYDEEHDIWEELTGPNAPGATKLYAAPVEPVKQEPVAWRECSFCGVEHQIKSDSYILDTKTDEVFCKKCYVHTHEQPVKQEQVANRKEQVNKLIKESARLIASTSDEGDRYLTAVDTLRNAYRLGLKDAAPLAQQDTHATHVVRTKDPCNPLQDLTDDEIGSIYEKHHALGGCWTDGFAYERAVIAADREKNK